MKQEYADWVVAYGYSSRDAAYGQCGQATRLMVERFPELTRVRGHYLDAFIGKRPHWWCVDAEGRVVDPTVAQFPDGGMGEYEALDDSLPEPVGKCMECGAMSYRGTFCSKRCEESFEKAFGSGSGW